MSTTTASETPEEIKRFGVLDLAILVLSVYVLGVLIVQSVFHVSPEVNQLLDRVDILVCIIFLTEFAVRFRRAPSKLRFMKWGWLDLISSIPAIDVLRWGRMARLIRIVRILRAFRSARHLVVFLYRRRTQSLAVTTILTAFILIIFSSVAILAFEDEKESNIRTPFDAVWWAVSTMTTVGYGDRYPITHEGKIVAMLLMVVGVGLFGVLTGLFARLFLESDIKKEDTDIAELAREVRLLRERIEQMDKKPEVAPLPAPVRE